MSATISALARVLAADSGIDSRYRHVSKRVTVGAGLELDGAVMKWYDLATEERPVPEVIADLAHSYLLGGALAARGLGFVILHRCGADFYFLIASTWRNENELWETVFYKDSSMADFAPFPREDAHKPVFCVWELAAVWHEQKAWVRFLTSSRDEEAAEVWLADRYEGMA